MALTYWEERLYEALALMRNVTFSTPLPPAWTRGMSLHDWFLQAVDGIVVELKWIGEYSDAPPEYREFFGWKARVFRLHAFCQECINARDMRTLSWTRREPRTTPVAFDVLLDARCGGLVDCRWGACHAGHRRSSRKVVMARVLLVDDDAGVLETCGAILRHAGFDVETAARGRRALDLLGRSSYDLLFIDVRLPDISGLDVLAEARVRGWTVPAIPITGYASVDTAVEAIRLGAVDYLEKPVFGEALVAAAERALGRAARQDRPTARSDASTCIASPPSDQPDETFDRAPTPLGSTADGLALWATAMRRVIHAPEDVPTVGRWAVRLKTSEATIHRWCQACRMCARASMQLARVLRAVRCAREQGGTPDRYLAVRNSATRDRLLAAGGVQPGALPTLDEALARQTLLDDQGVIASLRRELGDVDPESGSS